jgi:biopolymer transport protein ExbD
MTSLIDVIFLLLLFFMLSSTFSNFGEVELSGSGAAQGGEAQQISPFFLRLSQTDMSVNGDPPTLKSLAARLESTDGAPVLVSVQADVTAQRLTDVLVVMRAVPGLRVTVLGGA